MKKRGAALLLALLAAASLAACGRGTDGAVEDRTADELRELYTGAINAHGGEQVEYDPVFTQVKEDDNSALLLEMLGLKEEDMDAYAVSASMMNTRAYGIAAVMPAQGKEEAVKEALQGFIDRQRESFQRYLPDQYAVAESARLETLDDGTVLMVMTEGQDDVFRGISTDIAAM